MDIHLSATWLSFLLAAIVAAWGSMVWVSMKGHQAKDIAQRRVPQLEAIVHGPPDPNAGGLPNRDEGLEGRVEVLERALEQEGKERRHDVDQERRERRHDVGKLHQALKRTNEFLVEMATPMPKGVAFRAEDTGRHRVITAKLKELSTDRVEPESDSDPPNPKR